MGQSVSQALLNRVIERGEEMMRKDSWYNLALGFGTNRDKTSGSSYIGRNHLQDQELRDLYANNDYAAKIVNVYPREAMREGFCISGFDAAKNKKAERFIRSWNLVSFITDALIWSRLFGGGGIWFATEDGSLPNQPMGKAKKIAFMRFFDRRYLNPFTWYKSGPKVGLPETYMLYAMSGTGAQVGVIHESRLVLFPGARTEAEKKRELNGWDLSVLQVAYEALLSEGGVWKSIELLVSDANQAVFKINKLWAMMSTPKGAELKTRIQLMDLMRSVSRAILLDKETEDFERKATVFTGLPDLADRGKQRVASAAEIPVTVLTGEAPAGLNATGDSDLRWMFARIGAYRQQEIEPRILRVLEVIFSQEGSPIGENELDELAIRWPSLWSPTEKERAEIYNLRATANCNQVREQIVLPEEVAVSEYGKEEGGELQINVKARERILKSEETKLLGEGSVPAPTTPGADPNTPVDPNAQPVVADPNAEAKDPSTGLNGAQITALLEIVKAVADEQLPRESGIAMIVAVFPISQESAEQIMGEVGKGFKPKAPEPEPNPFGATPAPGAKPDDKKEPEKTPPDVE
jgi:phage-related protein (TIGR01555 family)